MSATKRIRGPALALAVFGLVGGTLAGCAQPAAPPPPPSTSAGQNATTGTVTFTGGAVALGVGVQWGSGTLTYRGRQYPFRISGLSVVDVGVTRMSATGTVRNLRNLADFNGNYGAATAGAARGGGAGVSTLKNQNGVTIEGISTAQGVRLTLAPGGVNITLSGQ